MIEIKVPATTANMGIGFDSLGCALNIYATFKVQFSSQLQITGCPKRYQNETNLFYTSYIKACETYNIQPQPLYIEVHSDIPVSRGLGSSAAMIVGGITAANQLHEMNLTKKQILEIATEIEGHPDNVAPAIYGGFTSSFMAEEIHTVYYPIHESLRFVVFIPDFKVSTHQARGVLPETIPYQDAIHNVSRMATYLKGLELGHTKMIQASSIDKLHEPYRKNLIHEYEQVKEICMKHEAITLLISGSGPTLLALTKDRDFKYKILPDINQLQHNWTVRTCRVDRKGVCVNII